MIIYGKHYTTVTYHNFNSFHYDDTVRYGIFKILKICGTLDRYSTSTVQLKSHTQDTLDTDNPTAVL